MTAGAKPVRYVSLVRQVRLQNVVRVGCDAMKEVVMTVGTSPAVPESFGTT